MRTLLGLKHQHLDLMKRLRLMALKIKLDITANAVPKVSDLKKGIHIGYALKFLIITIFFVVTFLIAFNLISPSVNIAGANSYSTAGLTLSNYPALYVMSSLLISLLLTFAFARYASLLFTPLIEMKLSDKVFVLPVYASILECASEQEIHDTLLSIESSQQAKAYMQKFNSMPERRQVLIVDALIVKELVSHNSNVSQAQFERVKQALNKSND